LPSQAPINRQIRCVLLYVAAKRTDDDGVSTKIKKNAVNIMHILYYTGRFDKRMFTTIVQRHICSNSEFSNIQVQYRHYNNIYTHYYFNMTAAQCFHLFIFFTPAFIKECPLQTIQNIIFSNISRPF